MVDAIGGFPRTSEDCDPHQQAGRRKLWRLQVVATGFVRAADRLGTRLPCLFRDDRSGMCVAPLRRRQTQAVRGHCAGVGIPQRLQRKDRNLMKRKASISHDGASMRRTRKDRSFAAEYPKAAWGEEGEPPFLFIASRPPAQAQGSAKVQKAAASAREGLSRSLRAPATPRLSTLV